mmetsp:Transcript_46874/g.34310  ORF Transcript_46874/g.34310 Transcript_46874/m.34310 type:complete len:86 (-) Transcript_46874:1239-1496(-)
MNHSLESPRSDAAVEAHAAYHTFVQLEDVRNPVLEVTVVVSTKACLTHLLTINHNGHNEAFDVSNQDYRSVFETDDQNASDCLFI